MNGFLRHLFLPHYSNNQRAKLLHHSSVFFIASFLIVTSFFLSLFRTSDSAVLGISVDISSQQLLLLTNQKRAEAGVRPLRLNNELIHAAQNKAQYMIAKDFWAHIAPDGTTPWDFIHRAGYSYVYAGENLARGFTTPQDVVEAWMASPEHRDNMLSPNYKDVGFAMVEGNLTGEKDTILVVEMLGSSMGSVAQVSRGAIEGTSVVGQDQLVYAGTLERTPVVNTILSGRIIALFLVGLFLVLLILDIIIVRKKNIVRVFEHNIDHVLFFVLLAGLILALGRGTVY